MNTKHLILSAALMAAGLSLSSAANASAEKYLGEIILTGYNFCPRGTMPANGQVIAINTNMALFSLYGTNFGGDGRTTFGLPDLRGRTPIGVGTGSGLSRYNVGQKGGVESYENSQRTIGQSKKPDEEVQVPTARTNMQPFQALTYCVVTQGIFPSRS